MIYVFKNFNFLMQVVNVGRINIQEFQFLDYDFLMIFKIHF